MRKLFTLLSLFVLASMILSACGPTPAATDAPAQPEQPAATDAPSQPEATEAPAKEAVLRINTGTYPDVIDPQKSSFVNEIGHLDKIYMGLSTLNEKLETVPGAADSWTFNDDATQLVFTLKPGLVYSDGSVLNAKRFEYSFQRNIDPTTAGEYASITDEIVGAPEWRAADTAAEGYDPETFKAALGVKASHADGSACADYEDTACDTLTLNFSKPAPYLRPSRVSGLVILPRKRTLLKAETSGGPAPSTKSVTDPSSGRVWTRSSNPSLSRTPTSRAGAFPPTRWNTATSLTRLLPSKPISIMSSISSPLLRKTFL